MYFKYNGDIWWSQSNTTACATYPFFELNERKEMINSEKCRLLIGMH